MHDEGRFEGENGVDVLPYAFADVDGEGLSRTVRAVGHPLRIGKIDVLQGGECDPVRHGKDVIYLAGIEFRGYRTS